MVSFKNLTFNYHKQASVLENISLEISEGNIIGILGKNGAGKTTLLKLLCGLTHPITGEIEVNRFDPKKRQPDFLEDVYFLPEEFYLPKISINDYLRANSIFYPKFDHSKIHNLLSNFELSLRSNLSELSLGQKKKFVISFGLATNCSLLVLDEPTNGLDIPSKSLFRKVLAGSLDERQTVLISTHQVKDVENLIDTIVVIDNGKIIFHHSMVNISEKLSFQTTSTIENIDPIYNESIPSGYKVICNQNKGPASDIDLELLFNALISGEKIMNDEK